MQGRLKYRSYLLWLALVTIAMALAMAVMLVLQLTQRQAIQHNSHLGHDSITAMAFQFEREFLRFRQVLDSRVTGKTPPNADELALRENIFISRLGLLRDNPSIAILQSRPEYTSVMPRLEQLVQRTDALLAEPAPNPEKWARLLGEFNDIGPDVQALSMAANSQISRLLEQQNNTMLSQNNQIVWLTLAQLILLLVASGAMAVRQRRQEQESLALQKLTDDLRDANIQAESANRGKSQFLANMSHELRTPFNGMLGMLGLLEGTPLNTQQADYVSTVRGSASHLLTLLNDILDVSALDVGKMSVNPTAVQLPRLLHDVEALMRPLAQEKKLDFSLKVHTELPQWVHADATRIKQILLNLASNAIKFSTKGQIVMAVDATPGPVSKVRLRVTDQGIGMDATTLGSLFQRFAQGDSSISRRFGGTGLGLEISRSLARLMGGDITADSQVGVGSRFTVVLPLECIAAPILAEPSVHAPLAAETAASHGAAQGLDIVVAEDHPVNRKYMEALLQRLGHRVRFAEDGAQALEEISRAMPDLVFMDVHMPVMDGLQATQALRRRGGQAATVPIVALTADAFLESRERALAVGMDDFLSKPVRVDQIEQLLVQRFGARAQSAAPLAAAPSAPVAPAPKPAKIPRRRFRPGEVTQHFDMAMVGEVCLGISQAGYRSLLTGFLQDESRTLAGLLAALDASQPGVLEAAAHAVKGAAANLGLHALAALAMRIEKTGPAFSIQECAEASGQFRELSQTAHVLAYQMGLTELAPAPA